MARNDENLAFARRLKEAIKRSPKRIETPSELALQFNLNHSAESITPQAAQKWLAGDNKPTPDKIDTLATMCGVSAQWLRFGIGEVSRPTPASSPSAATNQVAPTLAELEILARLRSLPEYQRHLVQEIIAQFALQQEMWRQ